MKKFTAVLIVISMIAMAGVAMAVDTATVDVSATVVGTCKFISGGSVSFMLDPSAGGNVSGTVVQPQFWCTRGASYTITDDDGFYESGTTHRMKHASSEEYIPYSFDYTASGTGNGPNNPITMDIASSVVAADYLDALAGDYADTVTLTITP
jgi:spore coat protein U-like protein